MTRIIDVDAHVEPTLDWLDDFPDLKDRLPTKLPDNDPRFAFVTGDDISVSGRMAK